MEDDEEMNVHEQFLHSVRSGDVDEVRRLINEGEADVGVIDAWTGSNALHYAAANGDVAMLQFLLLGSADREALPSSEQGREDWKKRCATLAALRESQGFLKGRRGFQANQSGNSPLHWALQMKQWRAALTLLLVCYDLVDVLQKNEFGQCPLFLAAGEKAADDAATESLLGFILQLMYEHPSAAALEDKKVEETTTDDEEEKTA